MAASADAFFLLCGFRVVSPASFHYFVLTVIFCCVDKVSGMPELMAAASLYKMAATGVNPVDGTDECL
jgi:hypothetical protein